MVTTLRHGIFFHAPNVLPVMKPPRPLVLALGATLALAAQAQLRLPTLPNASSLPATLPQLPSQTQQPLQRTLDNVLAPANLAGWRAAQIDDLLRRRSRQLERDPRGEPVVRGELLALPSDAAARERILAAGYRLLREQALDGLGLSWLVLEPPPRASLEAAVARLRQLDPGGEFDYHHLYTGSGSAAEAPAAQGAAPAGSRVGLVDAGLDREHPALRGARIHFGGCTDEKPHPSAHGTAVASLLVGRAEGFQGAQPAATLWAADVYCDAPTGGSVQAIAQALAWMAREQVPVVNISLVGPPNLLLQRAVAALVARGHLLVAAVGNDGPAAPPLYPAAWPGVVGVTATDARRRVLPEAGRGPHVAFAAPGADLAAAGRGKARYEPVRGTSFAAPLVAGLLAGQLARPDPGAAAQAVQALAQQAIDLGEPGRDPVYGLGLVGDTLRIEPQALARQR
jgi:subtilisin family serine protease